LSGEYQRAIRDAVPKAEICFHPFHVVRLAERATDQVRRDEWNLLSGFDGIVPVQV
jgi:transposase